MFDLLLVTSVTWSPDSDDWTVCDHLNRFRSPGWTETSHFHHYFYVFSHRLSFDCCSVRDVVSLRLPVLLLFNDTWQENQRHQLLILRCLTSHVHLKVETFVTSSFLLLIFCKYGSNLCCTWMETWLMLETLTQKESYECVYQLVEVNNSTVWTWQVLLFQLIRHLS